MSIPPRWLNLLTTLYLGLSIGALLWAGWLIKRGVFGHYAVAGPLSDRTITFLAVFVTWSLAGGLLLLIRQRRIHAGNALFWCCFFSIALLYIGVLRERAELGDARDYAIAAAQVHHGKPVHERYLYPPLLATALSPLAPLGSEVIATVILVANYAALLLFFALLRASLARYGFSPRCATLVTFLMFLANAPLLRNLVYLQVNLHLANLTLACLLLFSGSSRGRVLGSAFCLALAAHLKVVPTALALPFVLARQARWTLAFTASLAALAMVTVTANGTDYYVQFISNVMGFRNANPGIQFRNNSLDSVVRSLFWSGDRQITEAEALWAGRLVAVLVIAACAVVVYLVVTHMRNQTFRTPGDIPEALDNQAAAAVLNGAVASFFLMVLASPLVWSHHLVLLMLPAAVLLNRLRRPAHFGVWATAYLLVFLVPTFDFFPLSFERLAGILIFVGLMVVTRHRPTTEPPLERALARVLA